MNFLAAILAIMISALPVQTGFCDMQPSGGENPHMAMQHGDGGHGQDQGHDCCNPGADRNEGQDPGCDGMTHCGPCAAGLVAVFSPALPFVMPAVAIRPFDRSASLAPSNDSLPYRPPIYIS